MIEMIGRPFRDWFTEYVWQVLLAILPGDGGLLTGILATAILVGAVYLWWKLLVWAHSRPEVKEITISFLLPISGIGFLTGLLFLTTLWENKTVNDVFTLAAGAVAVSILVIAVMRIIGSDCPAFKKLGLVVVFAEFAVQAFVWGLTVLFAAAAAIVIVLGLLLAFGMIGGALSSASGGGGGSGSFVPSSSGSGSERKTLEDGTEIEKVGFGDWHDTTTHAPYKENYDGTFSRK